ncbi:alpha/beta fold hydrolase [Enterovirga sp. CN4-39]|uniref:alpha/beta fold hydrolase n=1 Tax=Enterovirga sp. CN4-39 TaxID=3400910 RepID=UPI003C0B31D6
MPFASVNGVEIAYETVGEGVPIIFCHEFASDMRAWHNQVRFFARSFRCVTYNYRGYPPSAVPTDPAAYAHDELVAELDGLFDHLGIPSAHVVGVATGGGVALNFAIRHPGKVRSLAVIGAGAGSVDREAWLAGARTLSDAIAREGMEALVQNIERAPQRQALRIKDPASWDEFIRGMRDMSPIGCSLMMANALMGRKPLFDLETEIAGLPMPVLVAVGDQDIPGFDTSIFVSRTAPHGALAVLPLCGHLLPVEEPALFNQVLGDFLAAVTCGRWGRWRAESTSEEAA